MPPAGFEPAIPASKRPQIHAFDRATTGIGQFVLIQLHTLQQRRKLAKVLSLPEICSQTGGEVPIVHSFKIRNSTWQADLFAKHFKILSMPLISYNSPQPQLGRLLNFMKTEIHLFCEHQHSSYPISSAQVCRCSVFINQLDVQHVALYTMTKHGPIKFLDAFST
jgi:hypothetical protein